MNDQNERLNNYRLELIRQYKEATGKLPNDSKELYEWLEKRSKMANLASASIEILDEYTKRCKPFNVGSYVEVGAVGKYNTLSIFDWATDFDTISPFGFTMQKDNVYDGQLIVINRSPRFVYIADQYDQPTIDDYRNFVTNNPNFASDDGTLEALRELAWMHPNVIVSIFGSMKDLDANQKITALNNFKAEIINLHGVGMTYPNVPIVNIYNLDNNNREIYSRILTTDQKVLVDDFEPGFIRGRGGR